MEVHLDQVDRRTRRRGTGCWGKSCHGKVFPEPRADLPGPLDVREKEHPSLVSYKALPVSEEEYDRSAAPGRTPAHSSSRVSCLLTGPSRTVLQPYCNPLSSGHPRTRQSIAQTVL
jgi:hypothetical protein